MKKSVLEIFGHPDFSDRQKDFTQNYNLKSILPTGDPKYSKRNMTSYSERTCIFCQKSYPEVTFSNLPHLVPQLIGNTDLYSSFECDKCNNDFSVFENDLANFIGISRSITGLSATKATPGFTARKLSAKSRSFIGDNILILAPEDIERNGPTAIFKYIKNKFLPTNVYKALLKSALSILDVNQIQDEYKLALNYLNGKIQIKMGALVSGYKLSFESRLPLHMYLFQKKEIDAHCPTHVIQFYFQNQVITFPLPLNKNDLHFSNGFFDIYEPPPFFTNELNMVISNPIPYRRDLSSTEVIKNEEETIAYTLNEEALKNTWVYDPTINETVKRDYDPAPIKYLILTLNGVKIDPKALTEFLEKQMKKGD